MAAITIDDSHWPLVFVQYPAQFSQAEWDEYRERMLACLDRREPFCVVTDTRPGGAPNAHQRMQLARDYTEREAEFKTLLRATAAVVDSPIVRGALTALTWLKSPPFPFKLTDDLDEASDWALRKLYEIAAVQGTTASEPRETL